MAHKISIDITANSRQAQKQIEAIQTEMHQFQDDVKHSASAQALLATETDKLNAAQKALARTYKGNLDKQMQTNIKTGIQVGNVNKFITRNIRMLEKAVHQTNRALANGTITEKEASLATKHYNTQLAQQKELMVTMTPVTNTFTSRMGNLIKSFVSAQLVVYALRFAFSGTINLLKDMSAAAADATETFNLFDVTFDAYNDKAHTIITQISHDIKVAQSSAAEAVGTVGDLLIGFGEGEEKALEMSDVVTRLVVDLMSFKNINGDLTETISAFTSGLLGNTKNLRRFGVVVKDADVMARLADKGLDKLTGQAFELAKVYERLNIVIEQSPNAIGDMERTLSSTVNVTRRLQESSKELKELWGVEINEVLTPIKSHLADILDGWVSAKRAKEDYFDFIPKTGEESTDATTSSKLKEATYRYRPEGMLQGFGFGGKVIDFDEIQKLAGEFNVSMENVIDVALETKHISKKEAATFRGLASSLQGYIDSREDMETVLARKEGILGGGEDFERQVQGMLDKLQQTTGGLTITDFISQDAFNFSDAIDLALGDVTESGALDDKRDRLKKLYNKLFQFTIDPDSTDQMRKVASMLMDQVLIEYKASGAKIEQIKLSEDEVKSTEKEVKANEKKTEEYNAQLELMKAQKAIADKYSKEAPSIIKLRQGKAGALQGVTDENLRESIIAFYDYQIEAQKELNDLADQEAAAKASEAANKNLTQYVDGLKESHDILVRNAEIEEKFAKYDDARIAEEERYQGALDTLLTTYQSAVKLSTDKKATEDKYKEGLIAEKNLHDQILIGIEKENKALSDKERKEAMEDAVKNGKTWLAALYSTTETYYRNQKIQKQFKGEGQEIVSIEQKRAAALAEADLIYQSLLDAGVTEEELGNSKKVTVQQINDLYDDQITQQKALNDGTEDWLDQLRDFDWEKFKKNFKDIKEDLNDSLKGTVNNLFADLGTAVVTGDFSGVESTISTGIGSATDLMATAAGPYAPLVHLAGGILDGLNTAIFGTIKVSKEAEEALDTADESMGDLFADILGMETNLADARMEALEKELELVKELKDIRLETLQDEYERGLITAEQYEEQATQVVENAQEKAQEYEDQKKLVTGIGDTIADLEGELAGMSGWDKFWSKSDEHLSDRISSLKELLSDVESDTGGLTGEEIKALAEEYGIDYKAANGADFVTNGATTILAGEAGRERVHITPAPTSGGGMSGNNININIAGAGDPRLTAIAVREELKTLARRGY